MDVGYHILDGNTDAVEFCPHDSFHNVLAASTYNLQEGDPPTRSGCISLFDVNAGSGRLEFIHKVETAGIFDIKWNPRHPLLAQADADGYVRIHSLQASDSDADGPQTHGNSLTEVCGEHISSSMCLCIDWNQSATSLAVGLSDGSVSIVAFHESQLTKLREWKGHEFEVWATSFDIQQPMLVYSGSDDCKFSCWDLRENPCQSVFKNTKTHQMGICCIAKSPFDPNTLLTGSYDEYLRIWDVRSISKPVNESSISLGGGVWRIKHHPSVAGLVLTACMHNGFAIVKFDVNEARIIERNQTHGSLAYGADWQRCDVFAGGRRKSAAIATCSFYDRLLRVWTPKGDIFV